MKLCVLIWLSILFIGQDDFVIKKKNVGSLKVGSYVTDVYDSFDKEKETSLIDRYLEASFSPAIQIKKAGELLFVADINCSTIRSFEIYSPKYKTLSGVSVGSNFGKLKSKHSVTLENREGALGAAVKELEMVFMFENTKRVQALDFNKVTLKDIPDEVKIASIIVY